MENVSQLENGTYIIAVSGGVDSVTLLDLLQKQEEITLIVAHFDHGIRKASQEDEQFVADLTKKYGLTYESERQELGAKASEALARKARYGFLERTQKKYNARGIITAHHTDDIIETMIINLVRGTGWRGLCSLRNTANLYRPFLSVPKKNILDYAKTHNLKWREDPTNKDQQYLRNAVRHQLIPRIDRQTWLNIYEKQINLAKQIDKELQKLRPAKRYDYIMWSQSTGLEVIRQETTLTRDQAEYALCAIKTAQPGSMIMVGGKKKLMLTRDNFIVTGIET